jgi:dihydroneopterin aldolase
MHKVLLRGMKFIGYHGVEPDEQNRPQPFVVDLEVEGDFTEAAARDGLELTVDCRELYEIVKRTVEQQRFRLLEALSEAIAGRILQLQRVAAVTVRLKKPEVRLGGSLDYAAVEITRQRPR